MFFHLQLRFLNKCRPRYYPLVGLFLSPSPPRNYSLYKGWHLGRKPTRRRIVFRAAGLSTPSRQRKQLILGRACRIASYGSSISTAVFTIGQPGRCCEKKNRKLKKNILTPLLFALFYNTKIVGARHALINLFFSFCTAQEVNRIALVLLDSVT